MHPDGTGLWDDRFDDAMFGTKTIRKWKTEMYGYMPKEWSEQTYEWNYLGFSPLFLNNLLVESRKKFPQTVGHNQI